MPGISGGTIALVTGVYETIITSAGHFLSGTRALVTDRARAREEFAQVRWMVIIPLVLAMIPAALFAARVLAPLVENHPVPMWALFLGMTDRKSTRLNSSHVAISYAVFCLKKKRRGQGHARR